MTRLALVADLHFGSVEGDVAARLADALRAAAPALVVVAGDLTMRARPAEFAAYLAWERALGLPTLVIPGNHDIPATPWARFRDPFAGFFAALGRPVDPELRAAGLHVVAVNTVAPWQPHFAWKEGRARRRSLRRADRRLAASPDGAARLVVAHHPFAAVPGLPSARPVLRAAAARDLFARHGVRLLMSGHTHVSFRQPVRHAGVDMLALGAPTAMSSRRRGEANGFWLVELDGADIATRLWRRDGADFRPVGTVERFRRAA